MILFPFHVLCLSLYNQKGDFVSVPRLMAATQPYSYIHTYVCSHMYLGIFVSVARHCYCSLTFGVRKPEWCSKIVSILAICRWKFGFGFHSHLLCSSSFTQHHHDLGDHYNAHAHANADSDADAEQGGTVSLRTEKLSF